MSESEGRRTLLVCGGSHCRKALRKNDRLTGAVAQLPVDVTRVGCQKICHGPVIGIEVGGKLEWFERMSSKKALGALAKLVGKDTVGKPLRKRRNAERSGKIRS